MYKRDFFFDILFIFFFLFFSVCSCLRFSEYVCMLVDVQSSILIPLKLPALTPTP